MRPDKSASLIRQPAHKPYTAMESGGIVRPPSPARIDINQLSPRSFTRSRSASASGPPPQTINFAPWAHNLCNTFCLCSTPRHRSAALGWVAIRSPPPVSPTLYHLHSAHHVTQHSTSPSPRRLRCPALITSGRAVVCSKV